MIYLNNTTTAQTISIPRNNIDNNARPRYGKLERKDYSITTNGTTQITPSADYDGISGGTISVNVPTQRKEEQSKSVTYTSNGSYSVGADNDKVLSGVTVNVNVPIKQEESRYITYENNGTYTISPSSNKVISGVTVTVDVSPTSGNTINNL